MAGTVGVYCGTSDIGVYCGRFGVDVLSPVLARSGSAMGVRRGAVSECTGIRVVVVVGSMSSSTGVGWLPRSSYGVAMGRRGDSGPRV